MIRNEEERGGWQDVRQGEEAREINGVGTVDLRQSKRPLKRTQKKGGGVLE